MTDFGCVSNGDLKIRMKYCKDCRHYWTKGTKGKWCCKFGKQCEKAIGHCKLTNGRVFMMGAK